jgi:Fe-S-cluster containining protein
VLGGALPLKADGSCANLRADNSCAIYPVRPEICWVRGNFQANARECNRMQVEDRMPESFRIAIAD